MRTTTKDLEHALSSLTITTITSFDEGVPVPTQPNSARHSSLAITTTSSSDDGVQSRTPATSENSVTTKNDQITRYFDRFAGFVPNHKAPLQEEFRRLATFMGWKQGGKNGGKRKLGGEKFNQERLICFRMEYDYWHGMFTSDNLGAWQGLCRDIAGVSEPPSSIAKCKKASGPLAVFRERFLTV